MRSTSSYCLGGGAESSREAHTISTSYKSIAKADRVSKWFRDSETFTVLQHLAELFSVPTRANASASTTPHRPVRRPPTRGRRRLERRDWSIWNTAQEPVSYSSEGRHSVIGRKGILLRIPLRIVARAILGTISALLSSAPSMNNVSRLCCALCTCCSTNRLNTGI